MADRSVATASPERGPKTTPLQTQVGTDLFGPKCPHTESDEGKRLLPGASSQFSPYPCSKYATISLLFFL